MNIRNKVAAASALVLAAGVLVSCGSSGTVGGSESAEQVTDGEITLSYWTWFPPQATLETVIAAFEDENPNITVELRTFEAAEYQKQLPLALSGGEAIDVVGVQVSAMTAQVQDYVLPVDDWAGTGSARSTSRCVIRRQRRPPTGCCTRSQWARSGAP